MTRHQWYSGRPYKYGHSRVITLTRQYASASCHVRPCSEHRKTQDRRSGRVRPIFAKREAAIQLPLKYETKLKHARRTLVRLEKAESRQRPPRTTGRLTC